MEEEKDTLWDLEWVVKWLGDGYSEMDLDDVRARTAELGRFVVMLWKRVEELEAEKQTLKVHQ